VLEVNRPDRATRRLRGKSDPTDAENAARAVLSGSATAIPKEQSGAAEAMRAVSVARRSAVKANTVHRWVIKLVPLFEKTFRKHKQPVGKSWRMDETYSKVKGQWK
jgi:hypothetical protein